MTTSLAIATFVVNVNTDLHPFRPILWTALVVAAVFAIIYFLIDKPKPPDELPKMLRPGPYFLRLVLPTLLIVAAIGSIVPFFGNKGFDQIVVDGDTLTFQHSLVGNEVSIQRIDVVKAVIHTGITSTTTKTGSSMHAKYYYARIIMQDGKTLDSRGGDEEVIAKALEKAGFVRKHSSSEDHWLISQKKAE